MNLAVLLIKDTLLNITIDLGVLISISYTFYLVNYY